MLSDRTTWFWQAERWKLRDVSLRLGLTTRVGRVGARYVGLVADRYPIAALFLNTGWNTPAVSAGLAVGPFELSFALSIRPFPGRGIA